MTSLRTLPAAVIGILSTAVTVGVGEAAAAFVRPAAAPVLAVGNRVIDLTPGSTARSAVDTFGTNDKVVLLVVLYVLLAAFGALIGRLAERRLAWGLTGVGVLAAVGAYAAVSAPTGRPGDAVPTLVGAFVGGVVLTVLTRAAAGAVGRPSTASGTTARATAVERRTVLAGGAAAAGLAAVAGFGGRALQHARFDVAGDRARIALPPPAVKATALPRGVDLDKGATPWQTPAGAFYKIDTTIAPPQIRPADWSLRIHGMVDREINLSYAELLKRPLIERWITLCCVSNEVGGPLVGNAKWLGVRLADVLAEAGVHDASDQLVMSSDDGMTIGAPTKVVMDGRDALIAVGMNGAPLPVDHGFPARIVVPGLYGYVSACKWVVDIEATTFAGHQSFWVERGWAQQTDIKLESRIDTPRSGARATVGRPVMIAGVAWDQHVGVSAVEVQVDGGPWRKARLADVPSIDTWRQWVLPWTPEAAGSHTVRVRATDGAGSVQTDRPAPVFPAGATGLHSIVVRVDAP